MEKWDLYSKYREKTGNTITKGEHIPKGYYRLVVHVAIFNSEGKMLIQKRQTDKSRWAGLWDLSVGGHVIAGETSQQAGERETKEELGIDISLQDKRPNLSATFGNGFDDMYAINMDIPLEKIVMQEEEVSDVAWATKKEIFDLIDNETFIPYHKSLIELLFFLRNHSEIHTDMD